MLFDSPELKKMVEQDNQLLSIGKIDWELKLINIVEQLIKCYTNLSRCEDSSDDFYDYSYMYQTDSYVSNRLSDFRRTWDVRILSK